MAYNPYIQQGNTLQGSSGGYLQGSSGSLLQGNTQTLQGSSQTLQGTPPPAPVSYGNTAATSPTTPKQQYINDLSGKYGLSGTTVYNKSNNTPYSNQQDFFRDSGVSSFDGLKFDTGYTPPQSLSFNQTPSVTPTQTQYPETTTPQVDPTAGYRKAFQDYIASLTSNKGVSEAQQKYSDFLTSQDQGINQIRQQPIASKFVTGESAGLLRQNESTGARLQRDIDIAKGQAELQQLAGKANVDFESAMLNDARTQQEKARTLGERTLESSATALLAQLRTLPNQAAKDAYIRRKATELGVPIDMVNSALHKVIVAENKLNDPIKLGEGDALFDENGNLVVKNPKTYDPSTGNGGLTQLQLWNFQNTVQDNMRQDPAIKAFGELVNAGVPQVIQSSSTNPQSLSDTLLMRTLAKVTDPTTGVREEEYRTFENAQGALNRIYTLPKAWIGSGRLTTEGRERMINEIKSRYNALQFNYNDAYNYYQNQLSPIGGTVPPLYGNQNGGQPTEQDPLGLGFNQVGNTSASTGTTSYLSTLGPITGLNGSPLWKWGLDIDLKIGQQVKTPVGGTVIAVAKNGGFGNQVKIRANDGTEYWFSHLQKGSVKVGQRIAKGTTIGLGGNTGNTIPGKGGDGSHLDLTVKARNGKYVPANRIVQALKNVYI